RRGGDRAAGGELALEQVPEPPLRRRGASDPAPERLQDRQPDDPRPDPGERAGRAVGGLWVGAARRRGRLRRRGPEGGPSPICRRARRDARPNRRDPRSSAVRDGRRPAALADARPADAEGLDRPEDRRPAPGRGNLAFPPGAARTGAGEPRAPPAARGMASQLPPGGAFWRAPPG